MKSIGAFVKEFIAGISRAAGAVVTFALTKNTPRFNRKLFPYFVLMIGLPCTAMLGHYSSNYMHAKTEARFAMLANEIAHNIENRMHAYRTILRGGGALFAASAEVTRQQWHDYTKNVRITEIFPGIRGFGFAKLIRPFELQSHIAQIRAEGFHDYTVRPEGAREVYTSIIYIEPFDARNRSAFGFDMFSEPVRRAAMEDARDSGSTTLTGAVKLVQETEKDIQSGFLMYVPVYKKGKPTATIQERRAALLGYVFSQFRVKDFMLGIMGESHYDYVKLHIYDGTLTSANALIYDSSANSNIQHNGRHPRYARNIILDIYGRKWTIHCSSLRAFDVAHERYITEVIFFIGFSISFLLFFLIRSQERMRRKAQAIAEEMTDTVRLLMNSNPESIFLIDTDGILLDLNETFARRVGINPNEAVGACVYHFFPEDVSDVRRIRIAEVIRSGNPLRFEDERFGRFIDNHIHPICDNQGKVVKLAVYGIDITERKQAEEDRLARMTAEQTSRAKSDFLSNMSHELRTPLNSILGFAEVLQDEMFGGLNDKQREHLGYVEKSSRHLLSLINDILDLSKVESGKMEMEYGDVEVRALLEGSLSMVKGKAIKRAISLTVGVAPEADINIMADERKLKQILYNLLSNAVKFTPDGGDIRVACKRTGDFIEISIADTGIGITPEHMKILFTRFAQIQGAYEKKYEGTGLGLALVKMYTEMHGGRAWAASEPGKGSRFYVTIPVRPPEGG